MKDIAKVLRMTVVILDKRETLPTVQLMSLMTKGADEIDQLRTQSDALAEALRLAKEMFIANDLDLPKTFEVINDALAAYEEGKE